MLQDARDCTILMSIPQFCSDHLNIPEDDFRNIYKWESAKDVWWLFRKSLGRGHTDVDIEESKKTKHRVVQYASAWVRASPMLIC